MEHDMEAGVIWWFAGIIGLQKERMQMNCVRRKP